MGPEFIITAGSKALSFCLVQYIKYKLGNNGLEETLITSIADAFIQSGSDSIVKKIMNRLFPQKTFVEKYAAICSSVLKRLMMDLKYQNLFNDWFKSFLSDDICFTNFNEDLESSLQEWFEHHPTPHTDIHQKIHEFIVEFNIGVDCEVQKDSALTIYFKLTNLYDVLLDISHTEVKFSKQLDEIHAAIFPERLPINKKQYPFDYSVIERRVIPYKYIQESTVSFHKDEAKSLIDYCNDNRLIVLLGDAGCGKSVILQQLAAQAYTTKYYPLLIFLSDYAGESIEELIRKHYPEYEEIPLLLIFDAFDEVRQEDRDILARKINGYVNYRLNDRIVISVRNNFYKFSDFNTCKSTFNDCCELGLFPFSTEDITAYVNARNLEYSVFKEQIIKNQLHELVGNPFYLNSLTALMLSNRQLPQRDQLMETLIDDSFRFDSDKYRNPDIIMRSKYKLKQMLQEIAFSMQLMNDKTVLSTEDYQNLFEKVDDRDLLQHSAIFLAENNERWRFEHNNFREYLAAKYLSQLDLATIQDVLCYDQEHCKIRESWLNVISYLVTLYQKDDLLDWLSNVSPELLVKFETSRIDEEKRTKLLIKIYEIYTEKNMYITRGLNQIETLADFGHSQTSIEFLIRKIRQSASIWGKANAILLLQECKEHLYQNEDSIRDELLHCILSDDIFLKSISIGAMGKLKLGTDTVTEIILKQLDNATFDSDDDGYLRYMIVEYIIDTDIYEKQLGRLLQLKTQAITEGNCYSASIGIAMREVYEKIESESGVKQLLIYFSAQHYALYEDETSYKTILTKAIAYYNSGNGSFYNLILELILKNGNPSFESVLKCFFIETNTLYQTIDNLLSESSVDNSMLYMHSHFFTIFAESDEMLEAIKKQPNCSADTTRYYIITVLNHLKSDSPRYHAYCEFLRDRNFPLPERKLNSDEEKRKGTQELFDSLFSRNAFQKLIDELLQELGDETLTYGTMKDKFFEHFQDTFIPQSEKLLHLIMVLETNSSSADSQLKDFTKTIQNWDVFCIHNLVNMLRTSGSEITVSEEKREYIRKYCDSLDIDNMIRNGIREAASLSIRYSYEITAFCFLSDYFDFTYSPEIYQKMTIIPEILFERNSAEHLPFPAYITKHLKENELTECVKKNLKVEKLCTLSTISHIRYCTENKLDYAVEAAEGICFNKQIPSYYKNDALKYLIEIKQDDKKHYRYIYDRFLGTNDEELVTALIQVTSHAHEKRLRERLELLNSHDSNKTKYLSALINMQSNYALQVYYVLAEERMTLPDYESGISSITESISNIVSIDALTWIFKLKDLMLKDGFKDKEDFGLHNSIWKALRNISDNHSAEVLKQLRDDLSDPEIGDRQKAFCNNMILEIESSVRCRMDVAWELSKIKAFLKRQRME